MINISSSSIIPSSLAANILGEFLVNPKYDLLLLKNLISLYCVSAITVLISHIMVRFFHFDSFSSTQSAKGQIVVNSDLSQIRLNRCLFFIPAIQRSMWAKEMKLFGRDLTQGLQLIMLLGISLVYIYNFRIVHHVGEARPEIILWWRAILLLCNIAMGSFIITAVSSRFVFPSLSLEGSAFWIIQAAPLSYRSVLKTKFWIWYLPTAAITTVILASGAMAVDAEPTMIIATTIVGWIMCVGLVGLAIGLGAYFANFTWDSAPQVAASFGNFVYMLSGSLLILLNMIPLIIILFLTTVRESGVNIHNYYWYTGIASAFALLCYINYATFRFSLRVGEEALELK
jgi:ABC-2 type transport system permease protein